MKSWCNNIFCILFFTVFVYLTASGNSKEKREVYLIPVPQELIVNSGQYVLTSRSAIDISDEELRNIVVYFNDKINVATGFTLPVKKGGKIKFLLTPNEELGEEGYTLKVSKSDIVITANKPAGVFYGVQSLLQLLPPEIKSKDLQANVKWEIPAVEIKDKPQFGWRGLMLDVGRHWFTKEEVKRYIDQLAEYKMNVFHWHLTDDQGWRIEIDAFPRLTEIGAWRVPRVGQWWHREPQQEGEQATYGGYYTKEDIKEVVAYAAERYVRVIPEVDVPGHSQATLVAYPEMACIEAPKFVTVGNKFYRLEENSLCIGKDFTFEFMEKVLTEVCALFPDEYFHIGGDECYKGFWKKCPDCQARMKKENLANEDELQSWFIHRIQDMLKERGKKLIGWDEIHEGGLAPDAVVMSWRGMEGGIKAAQAGHQVIMTPAEHCYIDLWQGEPSVEPDTYSMCRLKDAYSFNPVPESVSKDMILGGQGNLWAESVPTFRHAEYMTWPRGWALSEVLWSGTAKTDWNNFIPRVEHHFRRAEEANINYARSMYNAIIIPYIILEEEVIIELASELEDIEIYYTFDNTDPDKYTPKYVDL